MNKILFFGVLKLFIVNTLQNLIRYGDFQNIVPPSSKQGSYTVNCYANCDGIWYITSPFDQIQLQINRPVQINQTETTTTTTVDLVFRNYIQLCQDFNASEIGKTYQYAFDMRCNIDTKRWGYPSIKSCSVWMILNGQAINGSNYTSTDYLFHHIVGQLNITQQSNTICFQSRQIPFIAFFGTDLDNVTVQIYTEKTPCNVIGCKLCVSNFSDICQVFQQLPPDGSQCQSKFYLNGSICKVCLFPCNACQGQARKCLSCPNFYRLQQNQCKIEDQWTFASSIIASMPGIEFFSVGKIFLGILDQFWPYYSHHRVYGNYTIEILTFFHTLQNNKWFLLSLEKKIDFNFQSLNFSDYTRYSNKQFLKMESRTSYFWDGAFELVFFSFPTMLLVFFVFNKIFYLTFEYRISRHFRPYSFLIMIYFLGIREDISYLSFLSFSNGMNLFSFKFQDKLGHIVWIFVFFLLVLFCSAGYFITKIVYKKLSKYFIDGFFPKLQSFHILSCLSIKAFLIGSVNALLAKNYEILIISLGVIEMVFIIGVIYLQRKNRCYQIQTFMFLQILKSIIMTIFNFSLWIDWKMRVLQQAQTEQQTNNILDFNCKALVIVIVGLGALQAISKYFSGRETVIDKRQKQVHKIKKQKMQASKIKYIKQNAQVKQGITDKERTIAKKNNFYQTNAVEKRQKTQKMKKIKFKKLQRRNINRLNINRQQDYYNQQPYEIIIINGWN